MNFGVFANAALLGLLLMPLANAQLMLGVQGKIPFEFRIGDQTLPAGEYKFVRNNLASPIVALRNVNDKSLATMFLSSQVQAKPSENTETTKVVFHRYGKTYFLSQIWDRSDDRTGLELKRTNAEKTIAHQMAGLRTPDTVEVALNSSHRGMKATD